MGLSLIYIEPLFITKRTFFLLRTTSVNTIVKNLFHYTAFNKILWNWESTFNGTVIHQQHFFESNFSKFSRIFIFFLNVTKNSICIEHPNHGFKITFLMKNKYQSFENNAFFVLSRELRRRESWIDNHWNYL